MPLRTAKILSSPPLLELEESFSYGSFDEDDEKDNALVHNKNNSFRLNIRKNSTETARTDAFDRMRSMPLTRKEKLSTTTKLHADNKISKVTFSNNIRQDPRMNRLGSLKENDAFYTDSWRAKNISGRSIQSSPGAVEGAAVDAIDSDVERKSSRDDENASGPGYIDSFVAALGLGPGREDPRVQMPQPVQDFGRNSSIFSVQTVTTEAVEVRLSEKELRKYFESSVEAAEAGNWYVVVNNINSYGKKLVGFQASKYDKKNLFHIVASQGNVPEKVLEYLMEADSEAHRQVDKHGCVPLHYAASVGRCEISVKFLLEKWPFGASSRNVDGDLPLHVAVWSGDG